MKMLEIPTEVYKFCSRGAFVVGGAAKTIHAGENKHLGDWDLIMPLEKWRDISLLIPSESTVNTFGGWNFEGRDGEFIDIWPTTVDEYLTNCFKYLHETPLVVDIINKRYYTSGQILNHMN